MLPGRGRVYRQLDVVNYRDMVVIIRDTIQDMIDQKMTLEQIKAAAPAKAWEPRFGATSGPWTTNQFVEAVYKSLTNEGGKTRGVRATRLHLLGGSAARGGPADDAGPWCMGRRPTAQAQANQPPPTARAVGAIRSDRLLGVGDHEQLAHAHGAAAAGRLRDIPLIGCRQEDRRCLGSGEGRSGRQRSASTTARRRSCSSRRACASPGRTTTRCAWTSTPGPRLDSSASAADGRRRGQADLAGRLGRGVGDAAGPRGDAGRRDTSRSRRPTCCQGTCARTASRTASARSLTEYFDLFKEPDGTTMMIVTTVVEDPVYLETPLHHRGVALQEAGGRVGVGSDAVLGEMVASDDWRPCQRQTLSTAPVDRAGGRAALMPAQALPNPDGVDLSGSWAAQELHRRHRQHARAAGRVRSTTWASR